ncbi:MAG: peptidylprolyl isomerase [Bacteroidetes bacterium]|nr:peptidylprolyl isomerase [Bacteroidota bacterium]
MKFVRCAALLSAVFLISDASAQNTIVAEIDGKSLTLQEFEHEYAETIGGRAAASDDSLKEYVDFLDRYVNFRLKLKEADVAGYFENEDLLAEINGHRASFAKPHLIDNEILEPMVRDIYEKRKEYVHASHIMAIFSSNTPSPADTLRAWNKMLTLQDSLREGTPFGDLAERMSEDPSASSPTSIRGYRGDLGWFTGGQMIEPFEIAAYNTPVGGVSDIIRSSYGYHILTVHDRETTKPDYLASHIMVRFQRATQADTARAYAKMDSLKTLLDQGMDFAEVAINHSDDQASAQSGGSLGGLIQFRNPNLDRTFHDALFTLKTPGQISDIVETPFGLHLIKLDDIVALQTLEQSYDRLAGMVEKLPRIRTAEVALEKSLRELYTSTVDTLLLTRLIGNVLPDSVQKHLQKLVENDSVGATPLITLEDSIYTLKEFVSFASTQPNPNNSGLASTGQVLVHAEAFLDDKVLFYHSFELEHTDQEFKEKMRDYRNGLAIFRIMDDSVWSAASQDTLRLLQHYEANPELYQWPDRYRLIEIFGVSDSLLTEAVNLLELGGAWEDLQNKIAEDSTWTLQLDTVLVAETTNSVYDHAVDLSVGEHTEILSTRSRRLVLYMDGMEPARMKTFEEALSEVMADIQVELEQRLHHRLREKYRVTTFPDRLEKAFQEQ